jgi:hypothetical protein
MADDPTLKPPFSGRAAFLLRARTLQTFRNCWISLVPAFRYTIRYGLPYRI